MEGGSNLIRDNKTILYEKEHLHVINCHQLNFITHRGTIPSALGT